MASSLWVRGCVVCVSLQLAKVIEVIGLAEFAGVELTVVSLCHPYSNTRRNTTVFSGRLYRCRGITYGMKGDLDQAIADDTEALTIEPGKADAFCSRGIAYMKKGELDRAIADYTQAITLDPTLVEAHRCRGIAYGKQGKLDQAIADETEAIRLNPQDGAAYHNRSFAYAKKGDKEKSRLDAEEARRLGYRSD